MDMNWPEFVYPIFDTAVRLKSVLTGRGHPLHRSEGYQPFFVVGSGRCGSTLLRRILQVSPEVHIPPESYVLGRVINLFLRNRDRPWSMLVHTALSQFEFHPDFDVFGISLRRLAHRLADVPPGRRSLALILDSLYRYHGETTEEVFERWGDKTPINVYWLDRIRGVFPDAQFIHLVRDGVDVARSMSLKSGRDADLAYAATRWKTSLRAVETFRRRHEIRCCEVRYEKLVTNPMAVVERICGFLDISFRRSMIESLHHAKTMRDVATYGHHRRVSMPIDTESIGKGRRELGQAQRMELQKLIGPELERWGYDPAA